MLVERPHLYIFNREALVFVPSDLMITTFLSSLLFNRYLDIQVWLLFVFLRSGTLSYHKPRPSTSKW